MNLLRKLSLPVAIVPLFVIAQNTKPIDPHRMVCNTPDCRAVQSGLKDRYCGQSPYGNGPGETCDIKFPAPGPRLTVIAHVDCQWTESKKVCRQYGQPPLQVKIILMRELHRLGLQTAEEEVKFTLWKSKASQWSVGDATYSSATERGLTVCQVIVMFDPRLQPFVLREAPLQKTDADVPNLTTWDIQDLTDVNGDGQPDAILRGDAYEDHWLEMHTITDGKPRLMFSGLGYRL